MVVVIKSAPINQGASNALAEVDFNFHTDGKTCEDINECSTLNGGCNQICTNQPGSFQCSCRSGFRLSSDGKTCKDINECSTLNGGCNQISTNKPGSFQCSCRSGFQLSPDGKTCEDINECSTLNGGCNQICTNQPGSFQCSCRSGFRLSSDGKTCKDINECSTLNGGCNQICTNQPGSFQCSCRSGFQLASDGKTCKDINECSTLNGGCNQICTNQPGSFQCSCRSGFQLASDGKTCKDINECSTLNGGCNQTCTNKPGSFQCSCRSGFQLASDGKTCKDVNECSEQKPCDNTNGVCKNTVGSYRCSCKIGYELLADKTTCRAQARGCEITILSVDHTFGAIYVGKYFNFDRTKIRDLGPGKELKFLAYNPRTSLIGEVVVWGQPNGGSLGDAHGRFNNRNVAPKPRQWRVGDKFVPIDDSYCAKEKCESCRIPVLSVDHKFGASFVGQYFNFDRKLVNGLAVGQELKFLAYNPRTSLIGEVVIWGQSNGGSVGDAHGRFNHKNVAPQPGQWKTGDVFVPVDGSFCARVPRKTCEISILSVDHAFGPSHTGQYFNFDRQHVHNLGAGQTLKFLAYNLRTSKIGEVVVWGNSNGGSIGDSHGRFNSKKVAPAPGQWKTGDKLVPVDASVCKQV
uniref:EGF-like domain-containing protein n=1 Tax=Clytia hemisphaerica TaxID=252671 RepID=A0A7M5XM47_9CNID